MAQEKNPVVVEHQTITATSLVRRVRWKGSSQEIWIQNLDGANGAQVSFDGSGVNDADKEWWTIPAARLDKFIIDKNELHIKRAGAADVSLEILVFLKD